MSQIAIGPAGYGRTVFHETAAQQKNLDNPQNLWYIVAMMAHHFWTFLAVAHVCCVFSKWPGQGQNVDLSRVLSVAYVSHQGCGTGVVQSGTLY